MRYLDAGAWDFTLSWLIEPNRVDTKEKIVIFNHLLEDEPPITELEQSPWMRPLMQYPLSRSTLAECVEFLACSGARLIILDNDFPQYFSDDDRLARAIHDCTHGKFGGRKVPVLIAGTVVHRATGRSVQLNFPPPAPGVLKALSKLEPETDLTERYVGNVSMVMDEDQIVRRCVCARPTYSQLHLPSIAVKSLAALGEQIPPNLPAIIDIDFSGPPDSEDFPVRPMSYLLDPVLRQKVRSEHCDDVPGGKNSSPQSGDTVHRDAMGCDVTIDGSIVILGDGVVDRFATPYTNSGVSLRSGSEIIAQSIDTIARRSWPRRMSATESVLYFSAVALLGAAVWCWRRSIAPWGRRPMRPNQRLAIPWLFIDLAFYAVTVGLSFFSACLLFSHARLIVPLVIPIVSVTIGALATALRERELETSYWLKVQLKQAAEKLQLENEKHVIELRAQAAESQTRQIEQAESIRKDFVRKINHDLKAPVTVMSWTLAKWKTEGLACATAERKLERMVRTCDRLVSLLHELASNYEHAADAGDAPNDVCELNEVLSNCFSVAQSLAESRCSHLQLALAQRRLWVSVTELKLSRVFDNLIRNAIIHNPPGTSVFIEVQSRAHRHQITVRDNGIGIDTELLDKIFEPVDSAGREHLGLPIVKSFVEKAGGTITVFSKKGLGTTFTICLPSLNLAAGGDSCEHDLTMRGYAGRSGSRSARGDSGSVEPLGLTPATTLVAPEAMLVADQAMLVADQATLVAPEAVLVAPEAMLVAPEAMLVADQAMLVAPETTLVTSVPAPSGAPVPQRQAVHV